MAEYISYPGAKALTLAHARSFGKEIVELDESLGRTLAEHVYADRDSPPFNRAAMDGYAIRQADWESGLRTYQVQETIYAGQRSQYQLAAGDCFKIMTGAMVPSCADAVIRKEESSAEMNLVGFLEKELKPYQNIALQGENLRKDQEVFGLGEQITASVISTLAALGKERVKVERLPSVALFTTGDEVVPVGQEVKEAQIRNSNQHLLKALLRKWQIKPASVAHLPDKVEILKQTLLGALPHDVILLSGGVSAGDADFVPQVLAEIGVKKVFHKVAIKPGKPVFFGALPSGGVVFGLPGNPQACLVTFTLFVEPFLQKSFGMNESPNFHFPLRQTKIKKHSFAEFFPATLDKTTGEISAVRPGGSGDVRAGGAAYGLAIHPAEKNELPSGESLEFIPFSLGCCF